MDSKISHKGEKVKSYSLEFKKQVVECAVNNSNREAARKFSVDERRIREWRENIENIKARASEKGGSKRRRLDGGGRKLTNAELEEELLEWITERRAAMLRVSRKLIMKKAKIMHDESTDDPAIKDSFVASRGWLEKFMKRNGLSLRRRTTIAQKNPSCMIDKLVMYVIQNRRLQRKFKYPASSIIAMDETAIWSDMLSGTTVDTIGKKDIPLKTTGHEKVRVSVCLTAKADGTRLKPFIVFGGGKRECVVLKEEFKSQCVIASSSNAWMNEGLTLEFIRSVIGRFSFNRRLLAWDSFECHMMQSTKELLKSFNVDSIIIPGGCTGYIQAPDVSWNKPFKAHVTSEYDTWLSEGIHEYTKGGNMKAPSRRKIVEWVIEGWRKLSKELIINSFKTCGLNLSVDGSEDEKIHCFKKEGACPEGSAKLKESLNIISEEESQVNPFTDITDSDVEDACEPFHLIDEDHESDEEIDI